MTCRYTARTSISVTESCPFDETPYGASVVGGTHSADESNPNERTYMHGQEKVTRINKALAEAIAHGFTMGGNTEVYVKRENKHLAHVEVPEVGTFTIKRDQIEYPEGLAPQIVAGIDLDHRAILAQFDPA
jgi:hypothetical protein